MPALFSRHLFNVFAVREQYVYYFQGVRELLLEDLPCKDKILIARRNIKWDGRCISVVL